MGSAVEIAVGAGEGDDTTATFVGDNAGMDGSLADKGVAAIDVLGRERISIVGSGPTYH